MAFNFTDRYLREFVTDFSLAAMTDETKRAFDTVFSGKGAGADFLGWRDLPENYERYMDAFQFIKDVAVDWSDSRYLAAEPGEYIVAARKEKGGERWFVGGVTNGDARTLPVAFDFLDAGKKYVATVYADAKDADYQTAPEKYVITKGLVTSKDAVKLFMARGGGFAISLVPAGEADKKLKRLKIK